jgi:hypothetical protein
MHRERTQSFMFMYLLYRTSEVEVGLWVEPFLKLKVVEEYREYGI